MNFRRLFTRYDKVSRVLLIYGAKEGPERVGGGGIHKAVIAQIMSLQKAGIEVVLWTASHPCAEQAGKMGTEVDYRPAWHSGVAPLLSLRCLFVVLKLHWQGGLKACIHHSGRSWLWGYCLFPMIPQIQVLHRELTRPYRFFFRWLALSPKYASQLQSSASLMGLRRISWAPHCWIQEPPAYVPRVSSDNPPKFTIGFVGRFWEGKGAEPFLCAIKNLKDKGYSFNVLFAGDGLEYYTEKIKEFGIDKFVKDLGWIENIQTFFQKIDVLCLPSFKESFGLTILEAMSSGKAVVATDCNGPLSLIEDGVTGYLVPIGDVDSLTEALGNAMNNPDLDKMGKAGYERALTCYSPDVVGKQLLNALQNLGVKI